MARILTLMAAFSGACTFWLAVPLARLYDAFPSMVTALSIFVAAILVRLNRGMPTLEWKSVDAERRHRLTQKIYELSKEYAWILALFGIVILSIVTLATVGKNEVSTYWPEWVQKLCASALGGSGGACISRMAYVVWRDIDIVRLQKLIIDESALRDFSQEQVRIADEKITAIRSAGIRKIDPSPPKAWGE